MPAAPFWETTPGPWDVLVLGGNTLPGITTVSGRAGRKMDVRSPPGGDGARVRDRGYEPAQLEARNRVWTAEQLEALQRILDEIHPRRIVASTRTAAQAAASLRSAQTAVAAFQEQQTALQVNPTLAGDQTFVENRDRLGREAAAATRRSEADRVASERRPETTRTPVDAAHPALAMLAIRSVYVTGISVPVLEDGAMVTTISLLEWTPVPPPAPRPATGSGGLEALETAIDQEREALTPTATPPGRLPKTALAK